MKTPARERKGERKSIQPTEAQKSMAAKITPARCGSRRSRWTVQAASTASSASAEQAEAGKEVSAPLVTGSLRWMALIRLGGLPAAGNIVCKACRVVEQTVRRQWG